jgi:hypothetical protein
MWMRNVADEFIAKDIEQPFFTLIPSRFPTIDVFARVAMIAAMRWRRLNR